ncbi:unnamed protein product [Calicophoron daubneyi]|uniref:Uncharacterized protein n=1 Tax=Calicophoron daubneyi TaxID=300641 RepID=A0AAV2TQE1_CALDB
MRDRLLVLLLVGVGVLKIYEEYDDEEQEEVGHIDMIKHKHSRRDLSAVREKKYNPDPIREELIEASHAGLSPLPWEKCQGVIEACSCRRLMCYDTEECSEQLPNPTECARGSSYQNLSAFANDYVCTKRCQQRIMVNLRLCECRLALYNTKEFSRSASKSVESPTSVE